ncbi:MAG TPA: hypothetical protein VGE21_13385 [Flavobacteriales bacterium]
MLRHCSIALAIAGCTALLTPRTTARAVQAASPLRIRPLEKAERTTLAVGADVFRYRYAKGPKQA